MKAHLEHLRKRQNEGDENEQKIPLKQLRSSVSNPFDFKKHCLFCQNTSECVLISEYDKKIPQKHRKRANFKSEVPQKKMVKSINSLY